jgi:hypothetical protein
MVAETGRHNQGSFPRVRCMRLLGGALHGWPGAPARVPECENLNDGARHAIE